jgi:hypothetical protein
MAEQAEADVSKQRGQTSAYIKDPAEKRAYISRQGEGKTSTSDLKQEDYNMRNKLASQGSMKKGGRVKRTGMYKLHKNETVVTAKKSRKRGR